MRNIRFLICSAVLSICGLHSLYAGGPPWKFETNEGRTTIAVGFLAQPQFESLQNPSATDYVNNIFLRRFRLIAGGKINSKLSFFAESDAANLGKKGTNGKRIQDFYLQDAYLNYAFRPEFQLDAGMLLLPLSHNSGQSAATLLPIDYGAYSFMA